MSLSYRACLIDVFGTVLSVDFARYTSGLAERAGVGAEAFAAGVEMWTEPVMDGRTSVAAALEATILACGGSVDAHLLADLVVLDGALIRDLTVLHEDTVPFLEELRGRGVRTAFVSNCADNTRPLLDGIGLAPLVDELVLSCEVGAAKPRPEIFEVALERLGAVAGDAVFVDDQQAYCDGASALGIRAVRIDRLDGGGDVGTLAELVAYF